MSAAPDRDIGLPPPHDRCAVEAMAAGERGFATAPPVTSWLLVEHSGSWPRQAAATLLPSLLPANVAAGLTTVIRHGLRPLLIRRPGRTRPGRPRAVYVGASRARESWLERLDVSELADWADLDIASVAEGERGHGTPVDRPLLLVCTHSSRDLCCSLDGRPLALGLAKTHGKDVWECSHVGGDRFAGNLVILPFGEYHGRVDANTGAAIAAAAAAGDVRLENFRGRTVYDGWQQAAEIAVRERIGNLRRAAVVCGPTRHENGSGVVDVTAEGELWRVSVRRRTLTPQPSTRCTGRLVPIAHEVGHLELVTRVASPADSG